MAIFSYDNINAKKNDYNDDVIDSMYEMCQDMLDVLDEYTSESELESQRIRLLKQEKALRAEKQKQKEGFQKSFQKYMKESDKAEAMNRAYDARQKAEREKEESLARKIYTKAGLNPRLWDKKAAVKETCYMILDMLDDMD